MKLERFLQARDALKRYIALFPEDAIARQALAEAEKAKP